MGYETGLLVFLKGMLHTMYMRNIVSAFFFMVNLGFPDTNSSDVSDRILCRFRISRLGSKSLKI